ncbi:hypoxanthine phosphoribosyltransferase [Algoriphagus aquatilis]|uniref:Hypoxanthine phosphoribosyltransferase n=1 Tax=Algoriphagus aquatilis TaxID=490186 RepID=A0ABW0BXS3_9BACT|nr:hypoxanthine phosphoribosyltransferase [Algoriphagus sp.]
MKKIKLKEKDFEIYLSDSQINSRITEIGLKIKEDFDGEEVILLGILNGSFVFMADLVRKINLSVHCEFLRISSYQGTSTTEKVKTVMGLTTDIFNKNVIVVEDIVDTGISMNFLLSELSKKNPKRLAIATLLFKKDAFRFNYPLDYVGFEIPNKFVVGYGLDYDGLGRNFPDIYQLSTTK